MTKLKTPKGTELPLINMKGKEYLQVAYRLVWFTEEVPFFTIDTEFVKIDDEQTIARATICEFDDNGKLKRKATGTKRETKKDFADHTEKAETGAIGRALIELGYGTQFALAELDEGNRIVDAPVAVPAKQVSRTVTENATTEVTLTYDEAVKTGEMATPPSAKRSSFRKPKESVKVDTTTPVSQSTTNGDGWE